MVPVISCRHVRLEELFDLRIAQRSPIAFLVCFNAAHTVVERDDDEKTVMKISLCPRGARCWFSIALLDLRLRFADSCKGGCATQHKRSDAAGDSHFRSPLPSELAATEKNYWDGGVVSVGAVAGDSVVVVVSEEGVGLGLSPGVTGSVLRSQAASIAAANNMQTYFIMARF